MRNPAIPIDAQRVALGAILEQVIALLLTARQYPDASAPHVDALDDALHGVELASNQIHGYTL